MSPEILNLILTGVNILIVFFLVLITYKYTKATQTIAKLEEERKKWDVQPMIVPFEKILHELIHKRENVGDKYFRIVGLKNIGRGVAKINALKFEYWTSYDEWNKNILEYTLPIYLGVGEEFIYKKMVKDEKFKYRELFIELEYSDIHDNIYKMKLARGTITKS